MEDEILKQERAQERFAGFIWEEREKSETGETYLPFLEKFHNPNNKARNEAREKVLAWRKKKDVIDPEKFDFEAFTNKE